MIEEGARASGFTLPSRDGEDTSLRTSPAVLYF